jgi:hypothetical protein
MISTAAILPVPDARCTKVWQRTVLNNEASRIWIRKRSLYGNRSIILSTA